MVTRKMGNAVSPVVDLTKDGEEYTLSSSSTFKNVILKFKPGVEFDQETPDGRKVKATITVDGNTLHEIQKDPGSGKETVIDRTFTDDEVKMVSWESFEDLFDFLVAGDERGGNHCHQDL